jgi:SAM-dependent methyltransferase
MSLAVELVEQTYWDATYRDCHFEAPPPDDLLRTWIEDFVPPAVGSCFEIGCFPGRYLSVFGDLGYELNGIDITPRVNEELSEWLKQRGYRVGEILHGDFRDYCTARKYDVVCSFGFIEHFEEWPDILIKHAVLVREGGYLVVSTPNFRGLVQRILHVTLDRENHRRHNIAAMRPVLWSKLIQDMNFHLLFSGCFGPFGFWNEEQRRNRVQNEALHYIYRLMPSLQKTLPENKKSYSPFCGLIARKK